MALPLRDDVPTRRVPWVTIGLIVANVVIFLFLQPSAFQSPPTEDALRTDPAQQVRVLEANDFSYRWGAIPCEVLSGRPLADRPAGCHDGAAAERAASESNQSPDKVPWVALVTSIFLHGSLTHLAGNMLFLWVFGNNVEDRLGKVLYLVVYLVGGVLASMGFVLANQHGVTPLVGASGAIAVAMGAYLVFHPRGRILTVVAPASFQLVYVPAAVVLALFFVTQFFTADSNVAWEAHAAGMVVGFLAALLVLVLEHVRPTEPQGPGTSAVPARTGTF